MDLNLNELGKLVASYEQKIRSAEEKIGLTVFEYASSIFKNEQRVIYKDEHSTSDGKEYVIVLRCPSDCYLINNSIWGTMLYINCLPVKKNSKTAKRGLISAPIKYLNIK